MSENEPPPTYEIATNHVPTTRSNIPPSYSFVALNHHAVHQQNVDQTDAPSFVPVIYDNDSPMIQQTRVTRLKRLDYGMRALLVILFIGGVIYTALLLIKKFFKDLDI